MGLPIGKDRKEISYVIWNARKREDTTQRVDVKWTGLTGERVGIGIIMWCRVEGKDSELKLIA